MSELQQQLSIFTQIDLAQSSVADVAAQEATKPVVVVTHSKDVHLSFQHTSFLLELFFLFRGRSDVALYRTITEEDSVAVSVFKSGVQAAKVTPEAELKENVATLVEQIGWSPECPSEAELKNYLSPVDYKELLSDVEAYTTTQHDCIANAANVSAVIWRAFEAAKRPINWAGFYFVRPLVNPKPTDHDQILILGPFIGKPACSRIRFQNGVCGAAATTKAVQRIRDVHTFEGHIACDGASQSELVVPVVNSQGQVVALIDLDCPELNGFSAEDERQMVRVAEIMAERCDWFTFTHPYKQ